MRKNTVRGIKRKTKNMIKRIETNSLDFPSDFQNDYWHLPVPVARDYINSSTKVKRLCIKTLVERAEHLIRMKPNNSEGYRVVVAITFPDLWGSQIIVFKGESYFKSFFNRNNEYEKWILLLDKRNISTELRFSVPRDMQVSGYKKLITDEDGDISEGEIWFIGELK